MRIILLFFAFLFFSCSVVKIEKRKYSKGFLIHTNKIRRLSSINENQNFQRDTATIDENAVAQCFTDEEFKKSKIIIGSEAENMFIDHTKVEESNVYFLEKQKNQYKKQPHKINLKHNVSYDLKQKRDKTISVKGIIKFIFVSFLYLFSVMIVSLFSFIIYGIFNEVSGTEEGLFYILEGILIPCLNFIFFFLFYRVLYSEKYQRKKEGADKKENRKNRLKKYLIISHILLIDFVLIVFALKLF